MRRPSFSLPTQKYVAYYRVSTKEQQKSGLGLEAQREAVRRLSERKGPPIIAEFTEIESGKNDKRPKLDEAIDTAKKHDAVLVVAKLDRLSRNVSFISELMREDVKFVCCDMPQANDLTIHIFAAIAEHERKRISERIKEALAAKKVRDKWKPGRHQNFTDEDRRKSKQLLVQGANDNKENRHAYHFIKPLREAGRSYEQIARELNREDYRTRRGKKFYASSVRSIYKRFEQASK